MGRELIIDVFHKPLRLLVEPFLCQDPSTVVIPGADI